MRKIPRTITSYYPDGDNPGNMKMFQDKTSQIRGFRFKRDYLKEITKEEYSSNYAVYFLFNEERDENGKKLVYIGQSKLGAQRIDSHIRHKDFWTYAIMFVSDNNVFDANAIDYMEYYFINMLLESNSYEMDNTEKRTREPNVNYVDKSIYHSFLMQIEFLLKSEGVDFNEKLPKVFIKSREESQAPDVKEFVDVIKAVSEEKDELDNTFRKYYIPKRKEYRNARVYYEDGKFYIEEGSTIAKPREDVRINFNDNEGHYNRSVRVYNEHIDKYVNITENTVDINERIGFNTPSAAAGFITAAPQNGWTFFEGIEELR